MGILDKVREAKQRTEEKLARGGGGGRAKFWRPAAGENKIRIMPPWDADGVYADQFWREVAQHWSVNEDQRGPVVCLAKTPYLDGDCPVCAFVDELRQDRTNVDAQKLAKDLRAKTAYLLNVVVLDDAVYTAQDVAEYKQSQPDRECMFTPGQAKVQIYACPVSIFDQVLGLVASSGQDITDLAEGRDLTIKKIPNKDVFKTRYEVYPAFERSAATIDLEPLKLPDLAQTGYQMPYEQLLDLLQSGKGGNYLAALPGAVAALPAAVPPSSPAPSGTSSLEEQMLKELAKS